MIPIYSNYRTYLSFGLVGLFLSVANISSGPSFILKHLGLNIVEKGGECLKFGAFYLMLCNQLD